MFEKIKEETYYNFGHGIITTKEQYENIKLPKRSTSYSAGYDFFSPINLIVKPGDIAYFPTGIKWNGYKESIILNQSIPFNVGSVLLLYPRSSYGFKYGFKFLNTTPVIDMDYYNNKDNDGHIILGFTVDRELKINIGDKICQGIIQLFMTALGETNENIKRNGGIGSTGV